MKNARKKPGLGGTVATMLVGLAIFADMLAYGMVVPFLPLQLQDLGWGPDRGGLLFASYAAALLVATPLWGRLMDRIGYLPILAGGLLGLALATLIYAFSPGGWFLVAARTSQGIAAAATWTAGLALIASRFDGEERDRNLGLALSGQAAGLLLGPSFGGWLFQWGGYRLPFLAAAGLALFLALLLLLVCRHQRVPAARQELSGELRFRDLASDRRLLRVVLVVAAGASIAAMLEPTLPPRLAGVWNLQPGQIGLLFGIPTLGYALAAPFISLLSARIGHGRAMLAGAGLSAACLGFLALSASLPAVIAALALLGIASGMVMAPSLGMLASRVEAKGGIGYGAVYALYNLAYALGMMAGPLAGGFLNAGLGLPVAYLSFGAVLVAATLPGIGAGIRDNAERVRRAPGGAR